MNGRCAFVCECGCGRQCVKPAGHDRQHKYGRNGEHIPEAPPTLEQQPLGVGAATEPPPLYERRCFVCGQVTPRRDAQDEPAQRIASMSPADVDRELHALAFDEAGFDERRVLLFVARRLIAIGQRSYGMLDIATDRRNMLRERNEEIGDLLVYAGIESIKLELKG